MKRRTLLAGLGLLPLVSAARELTDLEALASQNRQRHTALLRELARTHPPAIYAHPADPYLGPASATQVVLYFTDFNCPHCRRLDPVVEQLAREQDNVRFVFKLLPLFDASSESAALYALSTWQQARASYWNVHRALMQGPLPLSTQAMTDIAAHTDTRATLNPSQASRQALTANLALADRLKIFATPMMLVGEKLLSGYTDAATLKRTLAQAR